MRSLACLVLLVACSRHDAPAPTAAPIPMPAAAPAAADTSPGVPGSQDLAPLAHLGPTLSAESQHRPTVKVTPEHLFAALADRGITLATQHQVLATTAAASYCTLGVTPDTIAIAVCEYPSAKAAQAGRELLDHRYHKLVPDAERAVNGNTLVTVAGGASHRDVRERVLETFKSL
jgi:hypothetical protein